jgi:hypothetical protein
MIIHSNFAKGIFHENDFIFMFSEFSVEEIVPNDLAPDENASDEDLEQDDDPDDDHEDEDDENDDGMERPDQEEIKLKKPTPGMHVYSVGL